MVGLSKSPRAAFTLIALLEINGKLNVLSWIKIDVIGMR
jgi:hypothetical protein